jgi:hypothetical protein
LKLSCLTFWRSKAKIQDAIREAVRTSLADCEAIFRAQAHEGKGGSRVPLALPWSRGRRDAAA